MINLIVQYSLFDFNCYLFNLSMLIASDFTLQFSAYEFHWSVFVIRSSFFSLSSQIHLG